MAELTKEEFYEFYKKKIEPELADLDAERKIVCKKIDSKQTTLVWFFLMLFPIHFAMICSKHIPTELFFKIYPIFFGGSMIFILWGFIYCSEVASKYSKKLKSRVTSKILTLFGSMFFSGKKDIISCEEIKKLGLFPFFRKSDDDIVIGRYKGCNVIINETLLERFSMTYRTHVFWGVILKIQVQKPYKAKTVFGENLSKSIARELEPVNLESVDFMRGRSVYSSDQIESRYVLTAGLIEKLDNLHKLLNSKMSKVSSAYYNASESVSGAFVGNNAYIFIPTRIDFFDISIDSTYFDPDKYYIIYRQIQVILSIIDELNFTKKF